MPAKTKPSHEDQAGAKERSAASANTPAADGSEGVPRQATIQINDVDAIETYANFCRVSGTPEELIIDFGLNTETTGVSTRPIKIGQRLVVNFYTAKRLMAALRMAIARHEAAFGELETDIQKRLLSAAQTDAAPPPEKVSR